jgi:hypothetical protein
MKARRVRLLGHIKRMEVRAMVREMMEGRRKGRHRLRWMDDVVADRKTMKIKQWMEKMKDREKWSLIVKEAKFPTSKLRKIFIYRVIQKELNTFRN